MRITISTNLLSLFICFLVAACTIVEKKDETNLKAESDTGETLAKKYCASCHLFPDPGLLDKKTWRDHTLPAMAYRFGIYGDRSRDSLLEKGVARRIVEQANVFPAVQTISEKEWELIKQYYNANAPDQLAVGADTLSVEQASLFRAQAPTFKISRPAVSALEFDAKNRRLYIADCSKDNQSSITVLDQFFKPITSIGLPHPVSNITIRDDTLYILSMGHFVPSDEPAGQLLRAIKNSSGSYEGYQRLIKNLKRPVDVAYGDLNDDGSDEIVVCEFGNHTGSVSLFVSSAKNSYDKKVLLEAPGAIKVILEDMNNDGRKDVVVLMSQDDEGIDIYFNLGRGNFERRRVLRFPAVYGSVSFSLTDMNNDGHKDIVYINGDNADASRVLKPYHGLRIFINDQHLSFEERYFFPFNGAYDALIRDFDKDGDLDLSAIAFFADFQHQPERGFVYLENNSGADRLDFSPSVIKATADGRWITMIGADLNQDGNEDIVLGSFTSMQIAGDSLNAWRNKVANKGQPLLVLWNRATIKQTQNFH
jgi:hypothetical protein